MKSDIEIARSIELRKIKEVACAFGMPTDLVEHYGRHIAKVSTDAIDEERVKAHKLILVTAITPTKAGIGKTTVSIGLALGLNRIGRRAIVALREPSLGPCFGMKGGAAGGGYAQVLPMEKINLHFTGDFHAVTSAHNMISALLDNYIYQNQDNGFGLKEVLWRRVLDVNDRSLRYIVTGLGPKTNGITRESGFDITAASEIMAILCLATDLDDLRRLMPEYEEIVGSAYGYTQVAGNAGTVDVGITGADSSFLELTGMVHLAEGRLFTAQEEATAARVCIVDRAGAQALFGSADMSVVGKTVRLGSHDYLIVGQAEGQPLAGGGTGGISYITVYTPLETVLADFSGGYEYRPRGARHRCPYGNHPNPGGKSHEHPR